MSKGMAEAGENRKVAVKIVDDRGIESLKVVPREDAQEAKEPPPGAAPSLSRGTNRNGIHRKALFLCVFASSRLRGEGFRQRALARGMDACRSS